MTSCVKRNCLNIRNNEYDVEVIGCFKLFGGHTIVSDAGGRIITDKYYLFRCTHTISGKDETIRCGSTVARHICNLSGNKMPIEFNPFQVHHINGFGAGNVRERINHWDKARRQLYNAIMIFITKYGDVLKPGSPIFKIKNRVEDNVEKPVQPNDVLAVNTILSKFNVTIPNILNEFARTRPIRVFGFGLLGEILAARNDIENNFEINIGNDDNQFDG